MQIPIGQCANAGFYLSRGKSDFNDSKCIYTRELQLYGSIPEIQLTCLPYFIIFDQHDGFRKYHVRG